MAAGRPPRSARPLRAGAGQVRIIAGRWRGRRLSFPAAEGLRPTGDRLRETLFNWLQAWVGGSRCLDLFAGSGALGLEAASRGAAEVVLVERAPPVSRALRTNLARLDGTDRVRVVESDAFAYLRGQHGPFDLVFLDPPFDGDRLLRAQAALAGSSILAAQARVYVESPADASVPPPAGWRTLRSVRQGEVRATLYAVESGENCSAGGDQAISPRPSP